MSTGVLFDVPGPRARVRYRVLGVLSLLAALAGLAWVLRALGAKGQLTAEKWAPFLTGEIWTEYLLPGIVGTLTAAAISVVLAGVLGVALGMGRLAEASPVRVVSGAAVEFFRAVPVLLMMIFAFAAYAVYDVVPADRLALAAVVTGLTLYNASVVAELIRSGISALPRGQREAGLAVGMTPGQVRRSILLPQAVTAMLPSIVSQLVVVLKDSALGYVVTYEELLRKAEQIGNYKSNLVPAFIVVAALFVVINTALSSAASRLERAMRQRGSSGTALPPVGAVAAPGGAATGAGGAAGVEAQP